MPSPQVTAAALTAAPLPVPSEHFCTSPSCAEISDEPSSLEGQGRRGSPRRARPLTPATRRSSSSGRPCDSLGAGAPGRAVPPQTSATSPAGPRRAGPGPPARRPPPPASPVPAARPATAPSVPPLGTCAARPRERRAERSGAPAQCAAPGRQGRSHFLPLCPSGSGVSGRRCGGTENKVSLGRGEPAVLSQVGGRLWPPALPLPTAAFGACCHLPAAHPSPPGLSRGGAAGAPGSASAAGRAWPGGGWAAAGGCRGRSFPFSSCGS